MTGPDPTPMLPPWLIRMARVIPVLVVVGVVAAGGIVAVAVVHLATLEPAARHPAGAMLAVAPGGIIEPADLPESTAVLYRTAEHHPDVFAAVPCFCGCDSMLAHRHLLDCFVRADGAGWEAHAAGCGVCLGEAQQIDDLLATGETDPNVIRSAVVARWSDPYTNLEMENT